MAYSAPHGRPGWMLKAVIVMSGALSALGFTVVVPMLSRISMALAHGPLDSYMVKMISGVLGPAMVLGAAAAGVLADKIDRRPVMVGAALLFAAAGTAPFVLDSLPIILVTRFVTGVAGAAVATIGAAMVGDYFEEAERPGWMGALAAISMIVAVVSLPLAGLIADAGWRWPFLLYLTGLPVAALSGLGIKATRTVMARAPPSSDSPRATGVPGKYPIGLIAIALVIGIVVNVPGIYISFYLLGLGIAHPSIVGIILMLNAVVAAVLASLFGRVRQRLSARMIFICGFGAMAVGLGLLALAPTYQVAVGALLIMGAGMGWLTPNVMSAVVDAVDEHHRGRAVGGMHAAMSIAPALGVTALEPLVSRIGIPGVLLLTGGLAGVMMAGMAVAGTRPKRVAPAGTR